MLKSIHTLYIEDISIQKENEYTTLSNTYLLMEGEIYCEVPQFEGRGSKVTFECKGYSRHLSKDLFFTEAITDALNNLYNGNYTQINVSTTGWPADFESSKKIDTVDTNLIPEFDLYIKDLFNKTFSQRDRKYKDSE